MPEWKCYTFEAWEQELKQICQRYADVLSLLAAGRSTDGRTIYEVRLGRHRTCVICSAGIHGREWVNPVLLLHMIEEYAAAAEKNMLLGGCRMDLLLEHCSFCFVPMVNPDGYVIATEGCQKIRTKRAEAEAECRRMRAVCWKKNANGVDINRNFPARSRHAGKGQPPGSEPETKALIQVFCAHPQSLLFLDFHSRGRLIYYYRKGMGAAYNRKAFLAADVCAAASGYRMGRPAEEFSSAEDGGNSVHYYAENFRRPALTIETVDEKETFPLKEDCLKEAYAEIRLLPLLCARQRQKFEN